MTRKTTKPARTLTPGQREIARQIAWLTYRQLTEGSANVEATVPNERSKTPKIGRPLIGEQAKQKYTVMIEPRVAALLRQLGGINLSRGIALAAEAHRSP